MRTGSNRSNFRPRLRLEQDDEQRLQPTAIGSRAIAVPRLDGHFDRANSASVKSNSLAGTETDGFHTVRSCPFTSSRLSSMLFLLICVEGQFVLYRPNCSYRSNILNPARPGVRACSKNQPLTSAVHTPRPRR